MWKTVSAPGSPDTAEKAVQKWSCISNVQYVAPRPPAISIAYLLDTSA